jgi:hypothetical protein
MNTLQCIAAIVSALAWPLTVIWLAATFRKPVVELIPGLKRLRVKELELEFREKLPEPQGPVKSLASENLEAQEAKLLNRPSHYRQLSRVSPASAIMETWCEIEAAAADAFTRHASPGMRVFVEQNEVFEYLRSKGLISADDYGRIENLRGLRNKVAHELDISGIGSQLIDRYVATALELAIKLQHL